MDIPFEKVIGDYLSRLESPSALWEGMWNPRDCQVVGSSESS